MRDILIVVTADDDHLLFDDFNEHYNPEEIDLGAKVLKKEFVNITAYVIDRLEGQEDATANVVNEIIKQHRNSNIILCSHEGYLQTDNISHTIIDFEHKRGDAVGKILLDLSVEDCEINEAVELLKVFEERAKASLALNPQENNIFFDDQNYDLKDIDTQQLKAYLTGYGVSAELISEAKRCFSNIFDIKELSITKDRQLEDSNIILCIVDKENNLALIRDKLRICLGLKNPLIAICCAPLLHAYKLNDSHHVFLGTPINIKEFYANAKRLQPVKSKNDFLKLFYEWVKDDIHTLRNLSFGALKPNDAIAYIEGMISNYEVSGRIYSESNKILSEIKSIVQGTEYILNDKESVSNSKRLLLVIDDDIIKESILGKYFTLLANDVQLNFMVLNDPTKLNDEIIANTAVAFIDVEFKGLPALTIKEIRDRLQQKPYFILSYHPRNKIERLDDNIQSYTKKLRKVLSEIKFDDVSIIYDILNNKIGVIDKQPLLAELRNALESVGGNSKVYDILNEMVIIVNNYYPEKIYPNINQALGYIKKEQILKLRNKLADKIRVILNNDIVNYRCRLDNEGKSYLFKITKINDTEFKWSYVLSKSQGESIKRFFDGNNEKVNINNLDIERDDFTDLKSNMKKTFEKETNLPFDIFDRPRKGFTRLSIKPLASRVTINSSEIIDNNLAIFVRRDEFDLLKKSLSELWEIVRTLKTEGH